MNFTLKEISYLMYARIIFFRGGVLKFQDTEAREIVGENQNGEAPKMAKKGKTMSSAVF